MIRRIKALFVWISRMHHSLGFGVQSPTDYAFIRAVVNEHMDYYQYESLGKNDDWLTRKLGRLYFRLANWRQPRVIESDAYREYFSAGCQTADFGVSNELVRLSLNGDIRPVLSRVYDNVDDKTVLVVEGIYNDKYARQIWKEIVEDERSKITFDLYYCGIVMFENSRYKCGYKVNF